MSIKGHSDELNTVEWVLLMELNLTDGLYSCAYYRNVLQVKFSGNVVISCTQHIITWSRTLTEKNTRYMV